MLWSRSVGREIDLGCELLKPVGYLVLSQLANHGFVDELEQLGVQRSSVAPCAGLQPLVELLRNVMHVESGHDRKLALS